MSSTPTRQHEVQQSQVEQPPHPWPKLDRLSQLATRISVILGVLVALYGFYDSRQRAELAAQSTRLQSLSYVQSFIKEDFDVQKIITHFDYGQLATLEAKAMRNGGRNLYFSEEIGDVLSIGEHYERMGAELKLGYLDFKLVFEIVPFPDDFWERSRNLRKTLRDHWGGDGKPLTDLWSNFGYMCELYRNERRRLAPNDALRTEIDVRGCKE